MKGRVLMKKPMILAAVLIILMMSLSACNTHVDNDSTGPASETMLGSEFAPVTVLHIGDSFVHDLSLGGTGKFVCTITGACVVSGESDCPPYEWFDEPYMGARVDGKDVLVDFENFFTDGGAYDCNSRIILVSLTVENIDFQGNPVEEGGSYDNPNLYHATYFINLADMNDLREPNSVQPYYFTQSEILSSITNAYVEKENDNPSKGVMDPYVFELSPGESTSFTVGFWVMAKEDGSMKDLSKMWATAGGGRIKDTIYIDLDLEN